MDYIVVDFEWNQSSYGKGTGRKQLPFEIIEIGAVKLDETLQIVDTFDSLIKPKVYKKLYYRTRELTGITQYEVDHGEYFPYVIVDFMLWCGDDYMFCTWGNTDLVELQRNMRFYRLLDLLEGPIRYYNVQKLFRILCDTQERQSCALEEAVDFLGIRKKKDFHRAIHDAEYTAAIFTRMEQAAIQPWYSVDYYQNPKSRAQEIHLTYETHTKYISREFTTREDALRDSEVNTVRCCTCGKSVKKRAGWFLGKNKSYYCLAACRQHGLLKGNLRFKKTDEDKLYVVKTVRPCSQQEADDLRQMKLDLVEKRREKRHRQ